MKLVEKLQYISPDGQIYNLHVPPRKVVKTISGWGMPDYDMATNRGPYQHGETSLNLKLVPRTVDVDIRQSGCKRDEYYSIRDTILNELRPNRSDINNPTAGILKKIHWENGVKVERALNAFLSDGLIFDNPRTNTWDEFAINERLTFTALDPVIFDPNLITLTLTSFTDMLVFPATFPIVLGTIYNTQNITYEGTWFSYPTIEIDGPAVDFTIWNQSTDKIIRLSYNISTGETVTIDLRQDYKTVYNNYGTDLLYTVQESQLGDFALEVDPIVTSGLNVVWVFLSNYTTDTAVRIKYYTRYIGV